MALTARLTCALVLVSGVAHAQTVSGVGEWTVARGASDSSGQASVNNSFWQSYTLSFGSFLLDPRLMKYDASVSLRTNRLTYGDALDAQQGRRRAAGYNLNASFFPARPFPLSVQMTRNNLDESGDLPTSSVIRGGLVVPPGQPQPDFQTLNNALSVNWQLKAQGLPRVDLGYRKSDSLTSGGGLAAGQRDDDLHAIVSQDTRSTRQTLRFQKTSFAHAIDQAFNQHLDELDYQADVALDRHSRFSARAGRRLSQSLFETPSLIVDAGTGIVLPPSSGRSEARYVSSGVTLDPSGRLSLGLTGNADELRSAGATTTARLVTTSARVEPMMGLSVSAAGNYGTRGQIIGDVPLNVRTRSVEAGTNYRAGVRWLDGSIATTRRIGQNSAPDGRVGEVASWSGQASLSTFIAGASVTGGYERQHGTDTILDFGNYDVRRRRGAAQLTLAHASVTATWDHSISDRGLGITFTHMVQDTYAASLSFRRGDAVIAASAGGFDTRLSDGRDRTHFAGATYESHAGRMLISASLRDELTSASAAHLSQWNLVGFVKAEYTRRQFGFGLEYRQTAQRLRFAELPLPEQFLGRQLILRITRKFGVRL